ncbi:MAG: fluoride efflux transporter FluC, partial [Candidatus Nanopelagicales bacterium]
AVVSFLGRRLPWRASRCATSESWWATFVVNVVGCLLMGLLVATVLDRPERSRSLVWRPFLAVGVLGGFTTFSAFAGDAVQLVESGAAIASAAYIVGTLVITLAALRLGLALGRDRRGRPGRPAGPTPDREGRTR